MMNISEYLSREEIAGFSQRSFWRALRMLLLNWGAVLLVFWFATTWPNPLSLIAAVMLLAGRQLGLAVLMHECGHNTLFPSRRLNRWCGQWLAAAPTFADLNKYASGHNGHHQWVGTAEDPDLSNYRAYPVSRASFKRKMQRDLTGQTGYKLMRYVLVHAAGIFSSDRNRRQRALPFAQQVLVNLVLALLLGAVFAPWAYLLWLASFFTTYMVIVRIRQVAEHAAVPNRLHEDPRQHTRTTIPRWWERSFFAPNYVNYHLEHHLLAGVPCYRLKALHTLLKQRDFYLNTRIFHGYQEVLRHAIA